MMKMIDSKERVMYDRWANITNEARVVEKCKRLGNSMNEIHFLIKRNADWVFTGEVCSQKRRSAMQRLMEIWRNNKVNLFNRWKEANREGKIQERFNEKKKAMMLKVLETVVKRKKEEKLREAVEQFRKKMKVK